MLSSDLRYLCDRLQCSSLIVRVHNGDKYSLIVNCRFYFPDIDTATSIYRKIRNTKPVQPLKCMTCFQHPRMFRNLRDNMVTFFLISKSNSTDCQVIAL